MKRHYIKGAVIIATSLAIYPLMKYLAFMERGYHAHGGETLLLIFGIAMGIAVIIQGIQNSINLKGGLPEDKSPLTESEQSVTSTLTQI